MRKYIALLAFGTFAFQAKADIVVRGKSESIEQGDGNTYITCKGNRGVCLRIQTGSSLAEIENDGKVVARYTFNRYDLTTTGEGSTEENKVTLFGSQKL